MAVKTITIDLEAYDTLARHKRPGQSFSQVIKAHFGPRKTAAAFRQAIDQIQVSPAATDAIDRVVRRRRASSARIPSL